MKSQELLRNILAEKMLNAQKQGYKLSPRDKKFLEIVYSKGEIKNEEFNKN